MERMMDRLMGSWGLPMRWDLPSLARTDMRLDRQFPRVDVVDREDELLVRAELLEVSVEEGSVTIKGSSEREEKEERGDYYRCEIAQGAFSRTLSLPSPVDSEKAKATFRNGILELTLPKLEMAKRRSVKVE
ncbi:Hsp20/alpha crystallin family protein [Ectothiorhodospiraceae bacterium 2226]|nr:Hsp20/alpha crystallin family protein [Ectothiorhodospiraceae bacterium 2226]